MKKAYIISTITALIFIVAGFIVKATLFPDKEDKVVKVGFIYDGDRITPYTDNFINAQESIEEKYGKKVETVAKYNVEENAAEAYIQELVDEGCDVIITASYGYGTEAKKFAAEYPDIEFCQATCSNANEEPVYKNYHNFMGTIYQGRYITGVIAGMKIKEMIDDGIITEEQAQIGYVGAYPYPEVISGYTAFFMGVRSVVPEAVMTVKYTNTWNNYTLEKKVANQLIDMGCVVISQHSDTNGPAVACENAHGDLPVYHVGYNKSMTDIAPTTSLVSSNLNYEPYFDAVVEAMLEDKSIEDVVDADTYGQDSAAGFDKNWVRVLDLNEAIVAKGSKKAVKDNIKKLINGDIDVFKGDYTATNPNDKTDTISLKNGYKENEKSSAPTFGYVLDDVITVID
ncbi:MAG: BMP family ABC transporter substrate-binding protein [Lachnospiraceae bacterium]|nr:BMP family ABC transporter substrate-binding protein [Lachnospiraceae bacterium]